MATLSTSRCRNPLLQRLDDLESSPEWLNLASSISELTLTPARSPDGSHLPRRARVTKSLEFPRKNPPKPSDCTYCVSDSLPSDPIKNHHEVDMETLAKKNTVSRTLTEKRMDFDIGSTSEEIRRSRERLHEIFEHNRMLRRRFFEDQNGGEGTRFGSTETLGSNSNQSGASPDLGYIDHQKSINLSIEKQDGEITDFGAKIESLNREIKELDAANNKWHHFQQEKQNKMAASDEVDFSGKFKNPNDNITDSIDFYGEKWQWDHFNDIKRPKLTSTSESHSEKYHRHIFDIEKNYKMATIDGASVIEGKENLTNLTETNEHLNDKIHNTDESHCDKWPGDDLKSPQLVSSFSNSVIEVNCEYGNDYWRSVQQPGNGSTLPFVYGPMPYKSPRRYVESEVTIHYRSPVRTEAKEILSEEELARRSAENMRRIYQEERRRKYLQELHDIDSRRHTDNFTPSQKSPIPLNRYDDFMDDSSYRSRSQEHTPEPRLLARALYNFVGQTSRELSFRRGDIIVIRRQIDKNWYEGEHNAMIGLFPLNYVEILPYDSSRGTPKKSYEGQARAKFNFLAQTNLELSLAKGELVVLTRRVDENWFEGRIGNKKGIFPVSYVEVICEPGQHRPETPVSSKPVASPAAHSLLSNGTSSGKLSMGPHHYVPSMPVKTSSSSEPQYISLPRIGVTERNKLHVAPVNETLHIDTHSDSIPYRALYNYRPQNEDELELKEGDTVYVMEKCDDGWYVGSSQRTGYFGTFPGNYVERL